MTFPTLALLLSDPILFQEQNPGAKGPKEVSAPMHNTAYIWMLITCPVTTIALYRKQPYQNTSVSYLSKPFLVRNHVLSPSTYQQLSPTNQMGL